MDSHHHLLLDQSWLTLSTDRSGQKKVLMGGTIQICIGIAGYLIGKPFFPEKILFIFTIALCMGGIAWLLYRRWDLLPRSKFNSEFDQLKPELACSVYLTQIALEKLNHAATMPSSQTSSHARNCLIWEFPHTNKLIAGICIGLDATAIQIKPNYQDFLRKLYELQSALPVTIDIGFAHDFPQDWHNSKIDTPAEPPMYYRIFLTRTIEGRASKENFELLMAKLRQMYYELQTSLITNFAHFRFGVMTEDRLQKAFFGELYRESPSHTHIQGSIPATKKENLFFWADWMYRIINLLWAGVIISVSTQDLTIWYIIMILIGATISYLGYSHYIQSKTSLNYAQGFSLLTPFESWTILQSRLTKALYYLDPVHQTVICPQHFILGSLNSNFRFIGTKFYRNLLGEFTEDVDHISLLMNMNRILPRDCEIYHDHFNPNARQDFFDTPEEQISKTRSLCGLWELQMIFSVAIHLDLVSSKLSDFKEDEYIGAVHLKAEQFRPILQTHFPSCDYGTIDLQNPAVCFQWWAKSRTYSYFGNHLPIHFNSGMRFEAFLEIPDEIHKALPMYYPGEFSIPIVKDSIEFGSTYNPENGLPENTAGISNAELLKNILLVGQDSEFLHQTLQLIALKIFEAEIPVLIFDWNGSFSAWYAQARQTYLGNHIRYFHAGTNLGLQLFELPDHLRGAAYMNYMNEVALSLANCFQLKPNDIALLRNAWLTLATAHEDTEIELEHFKTEFGTIFAGKNKMQESQSLMVALMHLWTNDHFKLTFNSPLENFVQSTQTRSTNSANSWIIDMTGLGDMSVKSFFAQIFLIQLLHVYETNPEILIPKIVVSPYLDLLLPDRSSAIGSTDRMVWWRTFFQKQFALVGVCDHITALNTTIIGQFQNLFVSRLNDPKQFNLVRSLLNLDKVFTNVFSKASRKVSYQESFMRSLDPSMAVVLRQTIRFPFIFRYDEFSSESYYPIYKYQKYAEIQRQLVPTHLEPTDVIQTPQIMLDFPELDPDYLIMAKFLQNIQELLRVAKNVVYTQLFEILRDLLDHRERFAQKGRVVLEQTARDLIQQLVAKQYLIKNTITLKDISTDMDAFGLAEKVEMILEDFARYQKLQSMAIENSPSEEPLESESESEEIVLDASSNEKVQFVPLDAEECPDPSDKTQLLTSLANTSFQLLMDNLPELYVQSKLSLDHKRPEESAQILEDGMDAILRSIEKQTIPDTVYQRLQAIKDRATLVTHNLTYAEMPGILDHLKQIFMRIPA